MKLIFSSFILKCLDTIYSELNSRGIKFRPKIYPSDSWGCPNKVPIIGVPYSYCYPIFSVIEEDRLLVDPIPILKILRHETGHTICYSYRLYERKDWIKLFGDFNLPYPTPVKNPNREDFIAYLPDCNGFYSCQHPDEDFAETFGYWLENKPIYPSPYKKENKALTKLDLVNKLMNEIDGKKPLVSGGKKDRPYKSVNFR